jgi:diguanylate cyclase (GGDEF)-like protein
VLLLDLDGFKTVNDSLGHTVGDRLLVTVANRIKGVLRASDTAARLGGDEFAMLLDELEDPDVATATGHRLIGALGEPVAVDAGEIVPAGSIGVAVWSGQRSAHELLRDADAAMYAGQASRQGHRGRVPP